MEYCRSQSPGGRSNMTHRNSIQVSQHDSQPARMGDEESGVASGAFDAARYHEYQRQVGWGTQVIRSSWLSAGDATPV